MNKETKLNKLTNIPFIVCVFDRLDAPEAWRRARTHTHTRANTHTHTHTHTHTRTLTHTHSHTHTHTRANTHTHTGAREQGVLRVLQHPLFFSVGNCKLVVNKKNI